MFSEADKRYRYVLSATVVITLVLGTLIFNCPPALFPDPAFGFQVMRSMLLGGGFNLSVTPDQANVAHNTSLFLTWWSPGQYMLPYCFKMLFGVNMGQSAALTILFCDLLGIFGFYAFFRKVGFSKMISALSILFIISQQYFVIPYIFYNGGETLLFGFLGWFLYGCFSFKQINWQLFVFVILSGWIGFFCKSAFLWMYAAGLLCLWINLCNGKKEWLYWIKQGAIVAIPTLISLGTIYKSFLSKGTNPTAASLGFHLSFEAFSFPLASPLLSGFSVDDLVHGLVYHQDDVIFTSAQTNMALVFLMALSIGLFVAILKKIPSATYKLAVSAFYGVAILFFTQVFLRRLNISYEGRHFRIVGLLFIPGAIYLLFTLKPVIKTVLIIVWAALAVSSIYYFVGDYKFNLTKSAHGPSGFSQQYIDQSSLNYLQKLDEAHPNNALFAFASNDIGLEIMHNRIISMDPFEGVTAKAYIDNNEYDGHAGMLYVLLPVAYSNSIGMFELCFPNYKKFSVRTLSKGYVLLIGE
jgi:hypothetical protein